MTRHNPTIVFPAPREVQIEDRPIPEPGLDQLLIQTRQSLISIGTETTVFSGDFPKDSAWSKLAQYPFVPGYSNVGEVVEVGQDVDRRWIGRRVCTYGPHARFFTTTVNQARVIQHETVADEQASFFTIAEIVMNGVRRSNLRWGESAAVYGLGLLGQLTARFCLLAGAVAVVAIDASERRLAWLTEHPALTTIRAGHEAIDATVEKITRGRRVDVVFEVTGNAGLIPSEFEILRPQGRFVVLSSPRGQTPFDFHDLCNAPSYTIIGAHNYSHPEHATPDNPWTYARDAELFFDLLHDQRIDVGSLISHRIPFADAADWYPRLLENCNEVMGIVLSWH